MGFAAGMNAGTAAVRARDIRNQDQVTNQMNERAAMVKSRDEIIKQVLYGAEAYMSHAKLTNQALTPPKSLMRMVDVAEQQVGRYNQLLGMDQGINQITAIKHQVANQMNGLQLAQGEGERAGYTQQAELGVQGTDPYINAATDAAIGDSQTFVGKRTSPWGQLEHDLLMEDKTDVARAGRDQTNINMPPQEKEYGKVRGGDLATYRNETVSGARRAQANKLRWRSMKDSLADPDLFVGTGAEVALKLKKVANMFGIDVGGVGEAELFQALSNRSALEMRNPAGGAGMPGALSDRDVEILQSTVPGLTDTKEGSLMLIGHLEMMDDYVIAEAKSQAAYINKYGQLDEGWVSQWSEDGAELAAKLYDGANRIERTLRKAEETGSAGIESTEPEEVPIEDLINKYK